MSLFNLSGRLSVSSTYGYFNDEFDRVMASQRNLFGQCIIILVCLARKTLTLLKLQKGFVDYAIMAMREQQ